MSAVSDWIATTAGDYANLVDVSWFLCYKVPNDSAQHLSNTFFTTVLLGIEANPEPSRSLEKLQKYMMSAEMDNPVLSFLVVVYHLPMYVSGPRFTDADCLTMMHFPASARVVTLHLGCMPVSVTQTGLGYTAHLTTLVELSVTCCEDIDDNHMRLLSALTNLVELRLRPLKGRTSEGLTDGLSALTQLQRLYLMDAIHIKDETMAHIACSLSALRALSMANCPLLTDESMPYLCMLCLHILFFSNSSFITLQGVHRLVSQSSSLFDLDFRGCTCLSVRDRMQLQQILRSQHSANPIHTALSHPPSLCFICWLWGTCFCWPWGSRELRFIPPLSWPG